MIRNRMARRIVGRAQSQGIGCGINRHDELVLDDPRDKAALIRVAESWGARWNGCAIAWRDPAYATELQLSVTDRASEERRKESRAPGKRYGVYSG